MEQIQETESAVVVNNQFNTIYAPLVFSLLYLSLIYNQETGLNWLILSILVQSYVHINGGNQSRNPKSYYLSQLFSFLLAISVALYGGYVCAFYLFVSWIILKNYATNKYELILPSALFWGNLILVDNIITGGIVSTKSNKGEQSVETKIAYYGIAIMVVLAFFGLYYYSSPGFQQIVDVIFKDFSFATIGTLIIGFVVGLSFLLNSPSKSIFDSLYNELFLKTSFNKRSRIPDELKDSIANKSKDDFSNIFKLVLILTSIMAFIVVVSDARINVLAFIDASIASKSASERVHSQFGSGIFAICCGILMLIVTKKTIKPANSGYSTIQKLLYLFLAFNCLMALNTFSSNVIYVSAYGLTGKRLGVFDSTFITLSGLSFSYVFLKHNKDILWLVNRTSWICYLSIVVSILFPWDIIIAQSQLNRKYEDVEYLYLEMLENSSLPYTYDYFHTKVNQNKANDTVVTSTVNAWDERYRLLKKSNKFRSDFPSYALMDIWTEKACNDIIEQAKVKK